MRPALIGIFFLLLAILPLPRHLSAADDFSLWLATAWQDASDRGISETTLKRHLAPVRPLPHVLARDRSQEEFTLSAGEYLRRTISREKIKNGRVAAAKNRQLLRDIASRYGTDPAVLVALWGVESDYGRDTGNVPVVAALATLAWDDRRSKAFRGQMLDALRILDRGERVPSPLTGSWAGAMGQLQFMPGTFLGYAVDFDGDGKRDIWKSVPDSLASAANYLKKTGWRPGDIWGEPVRVRRPIDPAICGLQSRRSVQEWRALGVDDVAGSGRRQASLLLPDGPDGDAFLVYENFRSLLRWNRSIHFALSVGLLSDSIRSGKTPH